MGRLNKAYVLFSFIVLLLFVEIAYSTEQVTIEFLYWNPKTDKYYCETCPNWSNAYEKFLEKNDTINRIQNSYTNQVLVKWTDFFSSDGENARTLYNIATPNSAAIKCGSNFTTIIDDFNETYMREIVDAYLAGSEPSLSSQQPLIAVLALALSLGLFETFSPCLIILLSFVLCYTIGGTTEFKKGILKVTTFGIGFLCASVFLGLVATLMFFSMPVIKNVLVWTLCIFAIIFGLNSLGFNLLKLLKIEIETKPLIRKLAKKYVLTYIGLCVLGFLFYFLDPCIAPIFFAILPLLMRAEFLLVLLAFCLGVMIPFVGIGFLAGSIPKLVRGAYRYQFKIRVFSGLILIAYTLYLIVFYLII